MTVAGELDGNDSRDSAWLHGVMAAMRRRWWLVPATVLATLVLTIVYLRNATYYHSAELKVYAAPSSSGSRVPSALGGLAALTGLATGGASEAASPFRFYMDAIYAPEVAARLARDPAIMRTLFANEWDPVAKQWRRPTSLGGTVRRGVSGILGLPQFGWQAPDAARLQVFIADWVTVRQSVRTPVVTIGFDYPDPRFAVLFLERLHSNVDSLLREQQTRRTRGNIAFLAGKLETVTLAEQRAALVTALTEQERQAMLAYGNAPYAADPFDMATASLVPTRPRAGALLAGALVAGLVLGLLLAFSFGRRHANN